MVMKVIRKADIVASVPDRWLNQYPPGRYHDIGIGWVTKRILELKGTNFTAKQCEDIIGNDSWTACKCDECGEDRPFLIQLGQEPAFDSRYVEICQGCLSKALRMLPND